MDIPSVSHRDTESTKQPFLTVATVCFNAESTIGRMVESVCAQTSSDFEYVVVDGGSADATLDIVNQSSAELGGRLFVSSEPDAGIYDAMNKAIRLARGEYIIFINADDWCDPELVSSFKELYSDAPDTDVLCGSVQVWNGDVPSRVERAVLSRAHSSVSQKMVCHHQGMAVSRRWLVSIGGFNTQFSIAADYDLALRLVRHGLTWRATDMVVANYRLGGHSFSLLPTAREYRQVRITNGMNIVLAWALWLKNIIAGLFARVG